MAKHSAPTPSLSHGEGRETGWWQRSGAEWEAHLNETNAGTFQMVTCAHTGLEIRRRAGYLPKVCQGSAEPGLETGHL